VVIVALQDLQGIGVVAHQEVKGQPGFVQVPGLFEQSAPPVGIAPLAEAQAGFFAAILGEFRDQGSTAKAVPDLHQSGRF
jgi:hypothetical protein